MDFNTPCRLPASIETVPDVVATAAKNSGFVRAKDCVVKNLPTGLSVKPAGIQCEPYSEGNMLCQYSLQTVVEQITVIVADGNTAFIVCLADKGNNYSFLSASATTKCCPWKFCQSENFRRIHHDRSTRAAPFF